MAILRIYTDGACSGNQHENNVGGWGAVLEYGHAQKELWGGERNTTNNRMEMTALIEALSALKKTDQENPINEVVEERMIQNPYMYNNPMQNQMNMMAPRERRR